MKKTKFTLYGLLVGAVCAAYGSAIFSLLLILSFYGMHIFRANLVDAFMGFIVATLFSVTYSIVPGVLGGAYLASWLEKAERTQKEMVEQSIVVGVIAGALVSTFAVVDFYQFRVDTSVLAYALLAIFVASGMSWFGARMLAKDKKKFDKTPDTETL